jgi:hypothetical protein
VKDALDREIHKGDLLAYSWPEYGAPASPYMKLQLADVIDVSNFAILVKPRITGKTDNYENNEPFVVADTNRYIIVKYAERAGTVQ